LFAVLFWTGITLLLLDFTGVLQAYLGWMAKIQFLPAVMAVNVGVIVGLCLLTLLFGRLYCSVICPLGVLQDGISHIGTFKKRNPYKYRREIKWLRYGVWALFVLAIILGIHAFVVILAPYSAYGRMVSAVLNHNSQPVMIVAAVTLLVLVALSLRGGRTYCNTICPVGTTLSFLSRFAMFRPVIDAEKCKNCHKCEHACKAQCISVDEHKIDYSRCVDCFNCLGECKFDALKYKYSWGNAVPASPTPLQNNVSSETEPNGRRAFIAGTALVAGSVALKAQERKVDGGLAEVLPKRAPERETPLTPPGSKSVKDFYSRCTACQLCVTECPNDVLRPGTSLERFMQPEMGFEHGFCRPECTRCSQVCPSGAIRSIGKEEKTQYHVGTARVNLNMCLQAKGEKCGNCAVKCPSGAIQMVEKADGVTIPVVAEEICIGCGACEYLCPVRPVSAITVNGREEHLL